MLFLRVFYLGIALLRVSITSSHADSSDNVNTLTSAENAYLQGNLHSRNGNTGAAIDNFRLSVSLDGSFKPAWMNLGHLLSATGDHDAALEAHLHALKLDPDGLKTNYNIGVTLHRLQRLEEALEYYERVVALEEDHIKALYNMALIHHELSDFAQAARLYSIVMKLDRGHVEARLNYCNILFAADQMEKAELCYLDVLTIDSEYVRGLVNLAAFYAAVAADDNEVVDNDIASSSDSLTVSSYESKAIALYEKVLLLEPSNMMARHGLYSLRSSSSSSSSSSSDGSISISSSSGLESDLIHTDSMDAGYVTELFDSYSANFEQSLHRLEYISHFLVTEALQRHLSHITKLQISIDQQQQPQQQQQYQQQQQQHLLQVLDLGAGTGLVCEPLRGIASNRFIMNITAVDLSPKMLLKAEHKRCYNRTVVSDIVSYLDQVSQQQQQQQLREYGGGIDILLAADVMMYFGDLDVVLSSSLQALSPGGLFVFTLEKLAAEYQRGYQLQKSGRFAHTVDYIQSIIDRLIDGDANSDVAALESYGDSGKFIILEAVEAVPRVNKGKPVQGLLFVLQRVPTSD